MHVTSRQGGGGPTGGARRRTWRGGSGGGPGWHPDRGGVAGARRRETPKGRAAWPSRLARRRGWDGPVRATLLAIPMSVGWGPLHVHYGGEKSFLPNLHAGGQPCRTACAGRERGRRVNSLRRAVGAWSRVGGRRGTRGGGFGRPPCGRHRGCTRRTWCVSPRLSRHTRRCRQARATPARCP